MEAKYQKYKRKYLATRSRLYQLGGTENRNIDDDGDVEMEDDSDVEMEDAPEPETTAPVPRLRRQNAERVPPMPRLRRQVAEPDRVPPLPNAPEPEWLVYLNDRLQNVVAGPAIPRLRRQVAEPDRANNLLLGIHPPDQPVRLLTIPETQQSIRQQVAEIPGNITDDIRNRLPEEVMNELLHTVPNWQTMDHLTIRRETFRIIRNILVDRLRTHPDGMGQGPIV
jgi:hypothetical protein